ncbi:MAG: hypothetical protein BECKG1743D_GA0114223_111722 [Candidatus Kentron sp. G]|nr:MAG: hypothetical protein BECKG1743F_GA0114225_109872 [Candidatus Kentron sp. G]VFN07873.1 MAG: hypothetical protein BECKG1743D_GA0114223_111722 [Candidatus Kentron sp. G]
MPFVVITLPLVGTVHLIPQQKDTPSKFGYPLPGFTSRVAQGNRMKVFLVLRNLCIIPKSTLRSQRYEYRFG